MSELNRQGINYRRGSLTAVPCCWTAVPGQVLKISEVPAWKRPIHVSPRCFIDRFQNAARLVANLTGMGMAISCAGLPVSMVPGLACLQRGTVAGCTRFVQCLQVRHQPTPLTRLHLVPFVCSLVFILVLLFVHCYL